MPVRPWHLRTILLKAYFQPQNGYSKAQNDHELSDLSCSIIHLAWRPPTNEVFSDFNYTWRYFNKASNDVQNRRFEALEGRF